MRNPSVTSERILSGAERVFDRLGYAAARVEDILEAAAVSRRTFYQRFSGKEAVAEVLWDRAIHRLLTRVRARMDQATSPREAIVGALQAYVGGWGRGAGHLRDLFVDSLRPESPLAGTRRQGLRTLVGWLATEAEKAQGVRPPSAVVEHTILGLHGLLLHRTEGEGWPKGSARAIREAAVLVAERVLL